MRDQRRVIGAVGRRRQLAGAEGVLPAVAGRRNGFTGEPRRMMGSEPNESLERTVASDGQAQDPDGEGTTRHHAAAHEAGRRTDSTDRTSRARAWHPPDLGRRRTIDGHSLVDDGLVQDVYLTTSSRAGGVPGTPWYGGTHSLALTVTTRNEWMDEVQG